MTPARWSQIKELFSAALETPESERSRFLESACGGDADLRAEVERLLAGNEEPSWQSPAAKLLAVAAELAPGDTVAHYRIEAKLGEGGMGVVYKAKDTRLGRSVALKFVKTQFSPHWEREARAVAALNHPHIATLYEVGDQEGSPYLAMELVEGRPLKGPLPVRQVIEYGIQMADALAAAHAAGIVHRDLKPGNILVTEKGSVKVLDFGLAKLAEQEGAPASTQTASLAGTPGYMAPEQIEGTAADTRSDIFAFGCILYELLSGRRAFAGETITAALTAAATTEPKPLDRVPERLDELVRLCLRKDPESRLQHIDDARIMLEVLREGLGSRGAGSPTGAEIAATPAGWSFAKRWRIAIPVLLGIMAVGGGTLWFIRSTAKTPEAALNAVPLTTYRGYQDQPSFSPDGNQVAFVWNGEKQDNFDIYVKMIGTNGPPLRLTTDPASDCCPAWSPDGRFIAFLRNLPSRKVAVLLIPAIGGPERKIAEIFGLCCPAWSPDGNWLAISESDSTTEPPALFLLSVDTGEKRRLTSPPKQFWGDSSPAFSPDGRTLAFIRAIDAGRSDLYLLAFSDGLKPAGEPRQITFGNSAQALAWTADGGEIVYSAGWLVSGGLWRIAVSGPGVRRAEPQRLSSLGDDTYQHAISRSGHRLAYVHRFAHTSIWRMAPPSLEGVAGPGGAKRLQPLNQPTSLISSTRDDEAPQFSPDGKKIAFESKRSGNPEVWVCDTDGSNAVQLTSFGGPDVTTPRWSPDGERIAFDSNAPGEFDIYVVGATGGKPQRMTTHPALDGNPSWSKDGRWIYFDSERTGEQQVWKMPANGGEAIQVTRDGGFGPQESPDGRVLYYTKDLFNSSLWRISIGGGVAAKVLENVRSCFDLAIVDKGIYFIPGQEATPSIQFLRFDTNKISTVAGFEKPLGFGLTVSPDGKWILYSQVEQSGSELMLVENFR